MIEEVLDYLNNYFVVSVEIGKYSFDATTKKISGSFNETYVVGQYVGVDGSVVNSGIYQVAEVGSGYLIVNESVIDESEVSVAVWGMSIPKALLSLIGEISGLQEHSIDGVASESQGDRSITYKDGGSWMGIYKSRLIPYRRLYSDKQQFMDRRWVRG